MSLSTLSNVKAWLSETGTANDALLSRLLDAASAYLETLLNRQLLQTQYTHTTNGSGHTRMSLPHTPVTSVSSATIDDVSIPLSVNGKTGYLYSNSMLYLVNLVLTPGVQNVSVVYTAGYAVVPRDLEQACIELVGLRYKDRDRIGLVSKGLAGETITYSQRDHSKFVDTVVNNYRRVVPL